MLSRSLLAVVATASLSSCDHGDKAAIEANEAAPATQAAPSANAGQAALTEVWQAANPGVTPPALADIAAAFDPNFDKIVNAGNDADNAFITSTLAFIKAVQTASPTLCAEAPLARFTEANLAAVPAEALPAFRAMLTDRLAVIAEGATHTARSEDLMSGSMQGLSIALGDSPAMEVLPQIASGATYDATVACTATVKAWEAFDTDTQSPQLMKALYSGQL